MYLLNSTYTAPDFVVGVAHVLKLVIYYDGGYRPDGTEHN